jgi:hypothetical protein
MITAKAIATVAAMIFVGSVLHRALAMRLFAFDGKPSTARPIPESDLLLLGILPGLALIGAADTYLALCHLFRADVTAGLAAAVLIWRRHDTLAVLGALAGFVVGFGRAVRNADVIVLWAVWSLVVLVAGLFLLAQLPSGSIDVWVFQLPLSISLVDHSGFVYPQISHPFYGNNPLFFNLLFAQALLFTDHYVAANAVNIAVYVGFILALLSYARRGRALAFLVVYFLIASPAFFTGAVAIPLIDLPRSCFSVLAIVFADRYLRDGRCYDIVMSGLLVGAAIAGKYTELVTLGLIGLCLLPRFWRQPRIWPHLIGCGSAVLLVAGYWYIKNWILLGNPIYPFLFAHPGLSDTWVADYMHEMSRAFNPEDRAYVTNLLTVQGWRDFAFVVREWFFAKKPAQYAAVLFVAGIALPFVRLRMLAFCTVVLFVIWYAVMFNSIRWATPAYLLFFASAFVAWTCLYDWLESAWPRLMATFGGSPSPRLPGRFAGVFSSLHGIANVVAAVAIIAVLVPVVRSVARDGAGGLESLTPGWMDRTLFNVAIGRQSLDDYLSERQSGYAIYRYIAVHDLHTVFQPYDNGAIEYATAYNGGRDGKWLLFWRDLPKDKSDVTRFVTENNIRYFVYRDIFKSGTQAPIEVEWFGQSHVDLAQAVFDQLMPHAVLLMSDKYGWSLYQVAAPPAPK